jgi:transcriptional regulator with XRE-family HTH domain
LAVSDDDYREALALLVASKLDLLMADRGISQAELALRSGVHRVTVNQTLKAARLMSLSTLVELARAMDADVVIEFRTRCNSQL